jgi:hypothetical protein
MKYEIHNSQWLIWLLTIFRVFLALFFDFVSEETKLQPSLSWSDPYEVWSMLLRYVLHLLLILTVVKVYKYKKVVEEEGEAGETQE